MKLLAVINCKARKNKFETAQPAEIVYNHSFQFRAQLEFIKEYYSGYKILSTEYNLIDPSTPIEYYNKTLVRGSRLKNKDSFTKEELKEWGNEATKRLSDLLGEYDEIHLHISKPFLNKLSKELRNNPKIKHILQPNNPGDVKVRYGEVLQAYKEGKKVDFSIIGERRKTKYPRITFYHPKDGEFFGNCDELVKAYPHVDVGNLGKTRRGATPHTCGWVITKDALRNLYQTNNDKWRWKKTK